MNTIDCIYTKISNGQVHIAADTKYIGSVDSYNNWFTQFFAWLFGRSITVNFDGKLRTLNKASYTNLIQSLNQNNTINDISQRSIFRPIAEAATLPQTSLKMRDVITVDDRQALFKKLAIAISTGDTKKALRMIGKGAQLDTVYYNRANLNPSFSTDTANLDSNSRYNFTVFKAAPILQAALKGNRAVCQFLQKAGAKLENVTGIQYTFSREIMSVDTRSEVVMEPSFIPHHYHTKDSNGKEHTRVQYRRENRPKVQERTVVTTKDSRSEEKRYRLNPDTLTAIEF